MDNSEFKEIMEALRELSVDQAVLREKIETHLKQVEKQETEIVEIKKNVGKHEFFMKASLWIVGVLTSFFGIKTFGMGP